MTISQLGASFRDPSGFLFTHDGVLYRQINHIYSADYDRLMGSGLYEKLVKSNLLVAHTEQSIVPVDPFTAYKIIRPEKIPFISYPYEWSFSQLKDAALATLSIQKRALKFDCSLKDASAYNIQFYNGKAVLIDTLSFEAYQEGEPWIAYRQFCQHFLAPLALMVYRDVHLNQLLRIYIDGIPLELASNLLPGYTRLKFGLNTHIHLHARFQSHYAGAALHEVRAGRRMSRQALLGIMASLENTIRGLKWKAKKTEWGDYYCATNYTDAAFEQKKRLVIDWSKRIRPHLTWDLGANNGVFSRLTICDGYTVAFDIDPLAVEQNWLLIKEKKEKNLLPLILDLTNPSPALGWSNRERDSFCARGPADLILALALVHHLAISNNVPLPMVAEFFSGLGEWLIVEFVPKTDSQVQRLLRTRKDIFAGYEQNAFETHFQAYFDIVERVSLRESPRWLYLMKKHAP